ncbi:hypothetical protein NUW58_g6841 [Xylaria curta]|uniref:Uncharacterized protein n=1 Tax=Xylaria curta TaxID=42375 RepID=A0ACC1NNI2_9PEZI|nr:hypothetical protein NUW58_g6841 [Xylaria curta]
MLVTMHTPIFNLEFSSPHQPAVPSPLSSSPLRPSQTATPLSPRNPNTLPRRDTWSSPIQVPPYRFFKYASHNAKPNPLRLSREKVHEGRRTLFLKNVRQRADDKKWEQRGGDQEALKLEWNVLNRRWKQERDLDLDGIIYNNELEYIPETALEAQEDVDSMMANAMAQEEEAELDAMLSLLDTSSPQTPNYPDASSLSDDEDYDSLFMDILSHQDSGGDRFTPSGRMDTS